MQTLLFCLAITPFAIAADNAQLVQTNVNVQNKVESSNNGDKPSAAVVADADGDASSVAIQQDVISVQQNEDVPPPQPQPSQPQQPNGPPSPPPPSPLAAQSQQAAVNAQNVQLLKEANAQYQYQINSRYEEKTRPIYNGEPAALQTQQYVGQTYPYAPVAGYPPYYKENNQYHELGNGQRRSETNVAVNDGLRSQYENQDQSTYTHQRSQSYSEYGKGESSPEYNTYTYKRMYY